MFSSAVLATHETPLKFWQAKKVTHERSVTCVFALLSFDCRDASQGHVRGTKCSASVSGMVRLFVFVFVSLFVCLFVCVWLCLCVCGVWDGDVRWMAMPDMWKLAKCGRKQTELPRALSYFSALTVLTGRFWKVMSNRH